MSKARLEAFSDGVFAIVVTILVLEIHVPDVHQNPELLSLKLLELSPKILSFFASFILVTVWWVAHHQFFHIIEKTNRGLLWLNSIFLMLLAFVPFPTALIGEYPSAQIAVTIYGMTGALAGASFVVMRWYACFKAKLVYPSVPRAKLIAGMRRGIQNPIFYTLGTLITFASLKAAIVLFILIPLYYFVPGSLERHIQKKSSPS